MNQQITQELNADGIPIQEPNPNLPLIRAAIISACVAFGLLLLAIGITYALRHPDQVSQNLDSAEKQAQLGQAYPSSVAGGNSGIVQLGSGGGNSGFGGARYGSAGAGSVPAFGAGGSPQMQSSSKRVVGYAQTSDGQYIQTNGNWRSGNTGNAGAISPTAGATVPDYTSVDASNVSSLIHHH